MALVNQIYGATVSNPTPLLAIPLTGGAVSVVIKQNGQSVGSTATNKNGTWKNSFNLSPGSYTIEFSGNFRPVGKGPSALFISPVTFQTVSLSIPEATVDTTGPPGPAGPSGQPGATGSTGLTGPQGETGLPGAKGEKGDTGSTGPAGTKGEIGVSSAIGTVVYLEDPKATDVYPIAYYKEDDTISSIQATTDIGIVSFNIDQRSNTVLHETGAAGTIMLTSDLQAISSGATGTSFNSDSISAGNWLVYRCTGVSTPAPSKLWISIK